MKPFYYWLDPLRALSALAVLICHTQCVCFGYYPELEEAYRGIPAQLLFFLGAQGISAVAIFFILSGFLVGGRTLEKIKIRKISAKQFAIDRIFRIGVPLVGAVLLILIVNSIIGVPNEPLQIIGQFFGLQGTFVKDYGGVFWTMAYEIWFYVILFGIILMVLNRKEKNILIGFGVLLLAFSIYGMLNCEWTFVILLGILAFKLKDIKLNPNIKYGSLILSFIFYALYFCSRTNFGTSFYYTTTKFKPFHMILCYGFLSIFISQIVYSKPVNTISKWFEKIGNFFAKFSYSLFLTHYQVLKFHIAYGQEYHVLNFQTLSYYLILLVVALVVAYIFYYIFERNTKKIQNFFCNKVNFLRA